MTGLFAPPKTELSRIIEIPVEMATSLTSLGVAKGSVAVLHGEIHYGVAQRRLIESVPAQLRQAAACENADLIKQAATLCFGLIKNHPWRGGNKRTTTKITREFLKSTGVQVKTTTDDLLESVYAVKDDRWKVDEIEAWLRTQTF